MAEEVRKGPVYTGMTLHPDKTGGYAVWMPSDWFKFKLKRNNRGMLFSPYKDDYNTSLLLRKYKLKVTVTPDDMSILREAFLEGIKALPGVEIESTDESFSESVNVFDARFTFLEDENRRKRWVRNIYWGNGQLVLIAQGRTPEDFEYWLPMFYNSITTIQII